MIDIPNVPGVPALISYAENNISLLTEDTVRVAADFAGIPYLQWGIYLNGLPVILPAFVTNQAALTALAGLSVAQSAASVLSSVLGTSISTVPLPVTATFVSWDYKQDLPISTYQVEKGGFQSYNKVQLPSEIRIRLAAGGSAIERQAFLNTIDTVMLDTNTYDIVTPEKIFQSYNFSHRDFSRTNESGLGMIVIDLWLVEIIQTATAQFQTTQQPGDAGTQNNGFVTGQTPSASISQTLSGTGVT